MGLTNKSQIAMPVLMLALIVVYIPKSVCAQEQKSAFVSIFDGKTLNGWNGDNKYWHVENGSIVGEITDDKLLTTNTFIIWRGGAPKDFELKLEYRISKDGNSGINYRSEQIKEAPFALKGYQADIDGMNRYTGQNYEERGRTTLAYRGQTTNINSGDKSSTVGDNVKNNAWTKVEVVKSLNKDSLQQLIRVDDWNEIHLIIKGNRLQHFVNGILMSEVIDNDLIHRKMNGLLGVQVHVGPPMKVEYRHIMLRQ